MNNIPFNKTYITGNELLYIEKAINNNKLSGDGPFSKKVNEFIETKFGALRALFVTSCSAALDMAAILIDLKEGDEVIMPSYTFVSTANAVVLRGARPVFVDIDPDTMNIDVYKIEELITEKTKAIFVVHYAGVSCDMEYVMAIARKYHLFVVEDAAQGVNSLYKGKYLGTIGHIGCYSFHETKNYSAGEGGAILINDSSLIERAEIIREKGTNRSKFYRGEIDKYSWVDIGSSYIGSDINAAFLLAQLEKLEFINERRKEIYTFYYDKLSYYIENKIIDVGIISNECRTNYHMFYIIVESKERRARILKAMKMNGIGAVFHYVPLHTSEMGKKLGYKVGDLPITENKSNRLIRLPMYVDLNEVQMQKVIDILIGHL